MNSNNLRILAIAPSTWGFGFAVMVGQEKLVNWGVKTFRGDKNPQCLKAMKEMIDYYKPRIVVMEDHSSKDCGRSLRIRTLSRRMIALAKRKKVGVKVFSWEQVRETFFTGGYGTKDALAEALVDRFPELGSRLPPKRKLWTSEDYRMGIFDAVALITAFDLRKTKRKTIGF